MIHGVVKPDEKARWQPGWQRHTTQQLDTYIKVVSRYFEIISMDEAVDMLSGNKPVRNNCLALTFDDGYTNNITRALPVLEKHGSPATFYVVTAPFNRRYKFWIDQLDYLFQKLDCDQYAVDVGKERVVVEFSDRKAYVQSYRKLRLAMKEAFNTEDEFTAFIDALISKLESESGASLFDEQDDIWSDIAGKDELSNLPELISVGSHTVNHLRAAHAGLDEFRGELEQSHKELIEFQASTASGLHFCYPSGDRNEQTDEVLSDSDYISGVATSRGVNYSGANIYCLNRFPMGRSDKPEKIMLAIMRDYL